MTSRNCRLSSVGRACASLMQTVGLPRTVLPSDPRWHHGVRQQGVGPVTAQRPPCRPPGPARVMPSDVSGRCHAGPPQPWQPTISLRQLQFDGCCSLTIIKGAVRCTCSVMIRASGARGPGFNFRNSYCCFLCISGALRGARARFRPVRADPICGKSVLGVDIFRICTALRRTQQRAHLAPRTHAAGYVGCGSPSWHLLDGSPGTTFAGLGMNMILAGLHLQSSYPKIDALSIRP